MPREPRRRVPSTSHLCSVAAAFEIAFASDAFPTLPEAQIDRFMMRMSIGYPDHAAEVEVIRDRNAGRKVDEVKAVVDTKTVETMIRIARETYGAPGLQRYVVSICAATQRLSELRLGVSPRGSLALIGASQAFAAAQAREFVTPDDVKAMAP